MTKNEYLSSLEKALRANHIPDTNDILTEYEQHFTFKMADGYGEDEIAAKLEDPEVLAKQFVQSGVGSRRGLVSFLLSIALVFIGIFAVSFFIVLFAWVIVMFALVVYSLKSGVLLICNWDIAGQIPAMPYLGSVLMGICLVAFSVLVAVGTVYCYRLFIQLIKSYFRWNRNVMAGAKGSYTRPSLPKYPQLSAVSRRRLRATASLALALFGVTFVVGYFVLALLAGNVEFWHVGHWFQ
jgi:uncharacterized membrane protein